MQATNTIFFKKQNHQGNPADLLSETWFVWTVLRPPQGPIPLCSQPPITAWVQEVPELADPSPWRLASGLAWGHIQEEHYDDCRQTPREPRKQSSNHLP